jgi:ADP-glucose pyrophosphorylase
MVEVRGSAIDCGTPADYLRANLHVSHGASVVDPTAVVEGSITRCVVWPGAHVAHDEVLVDSIRTPLVTVHAS